MKLLGVELLNYARFERIFVPLDTGIHILAGKNNSGKTAVLRALAALTALPFENPTPFSPELAKYARSQTPQPNYFMNIHFRYDADDDRHFPGNLHTWPEFQASVDRRWVFSFQVFSKVSAIIFLGAKFEFDSQTISVMELVTNGVLVQNIYDNQRMPNLRTAVGPIGFGPQITGGKQVSHYATSGLLSGFKNLNKTRIVNAHRVVNPNHALQALDTLSDNADALAPFLDTLLSNNREAFYLIQEVITDIFTEFKFVNPHKSQNGVSLTLTLTKTGEEIPLTHCGTGVEQILALATFVVTAEPGTLVLLDEPHSYLHPTAERKVTDFLLAHSELRYVIATHSAILINSVHPDRILVLGDSDIIDRSPEPANSDSLPSLIHSLGYKNSDLLFNDRLILVEGESDQEILPLLLAQSPTIGRPALGRTGFPVMHGEGKLRGRQQQTSILYWEEFLSELGRNQMPRVYLFDGGCIQEDRTLLQKSQLFESNNGARLRFLKMHEIENYLLIPDAIVATLKEMDDFQGQKNPAIDLEHVSKSLQAILDRADNQKLYPNGIGEDRLRDVKGSVVLQMLFAEFGLDYDKRRTGRLLATKITFENQPLLDEIWTLFPAGFLS